MLHWLARNWWIVLVRGIAAILFGLLAFALPGVTLLTLIILYGVYALVDGIFAIIAAVRGERGLGSRWWLAAIGVLGVVAGLLTFLWPGKTALILAVFIGAWSLARGVFEIIGAIRLRKEIDNEWLLILSGALSVLFGAIVLFRPGVGALAIVWMIGAYAIVLGALQVGLSLRLRSHSHEKKASAR
jgi:uncharacterized membrane protein HdeD (DUF308 family)